MWATRRSTDGLDAVEHRLRVDAEEHDEPERAAPSPGPRARSGRACRRSPRRARRGRPAGRPTAGRAAARITPAAATTVHQRRVRNEPTRIRNSPAKPLRPGQADRAEHHDGEHAGEDRRRLLQALERGDLAGVAAVVDHPDEEEQGAGGDAVVHHLQHAALDALGGEGEGAEHDEAEVGDRGVGDEPLEVASASWRRRRRR